MDPNGSGKARYFKRGEIRVWPNVPKAHWELIDDAPIDFAKASKDLLMASSNWKPQEAINWLRETFGVEVPEGMDTERLVNYFISTREKQYGLVQNVEPLRASTEIGRDRRVKPDEGQNTAQE